jgi:tetratricopeptide (TPR) repeat protein
LSKKEKLLQSAQKYIQKGQLARALKDFQKVLELDPKDVRSRQRLAELFNRLNMDKEALEAYELVAKYYADNGFYLKAIAVYKQMQKIAPDQPTVYRRLATLNEKQGLIGNAMGEYRNLAVLYEKGGQAPEYNETLAKMKDLDPENPALRLRICQSYLKQDLKEKAHKELQELLDLLARVKNPEAVRKTQELVASFCPEDLSLKVAIADNLLASGQPREAVALLDEADGDFAAQAQAFPVLARAFRQLGDYARERKLYEQLLEQQADNLDWQEHCVRACLDEGSGADALDRLEECRQAFMVDGRAAVLKAFYEQLREQFPADARIRQSLHQIYEHTGDGGKLFDLMSNGHAEADEGHDTRAETAPVQEADKGPAQETGEEPAQEAEEQPAPQPEAWLAPEESEDLLPAVETSSESEYPQSAVETPVANEDVPPAAQGPAEEALVAAGAETPPDAEDTRDDLAEAPILEDDFDRFAEFVGQDDEELELELEIELELVEDPDDPAFAGEPDGVDAADDGLAADAFGADEEASLDLLEEAVLDDDPEPAGVAVEEPSASSLPVSADDEPLSAPVEDDPGEAQAGSGDDALADLQKELGEALEMDPFQLDDELDDGAVDLTSDLEEAEFYLQQEFLDEAEQKCQALLAQHPNCREAREILDQVAEQRQQQPVASPPESASGTTVPEPEPQPGGEQKDAGQADRKDQDRLAGNLSAFKKGLEDAVAQDDCETHYNLGIAYKEMGLLDEAMSEFAKAMGHASRYVDALTLTGICLVEKGDFSRAVEVFKQGLDQQGQTEQDRLNIYFEMGLLYVAWGRPLEALESFQRVADVDLTYREVGDQVRRLRSQLGLDDEEGPGPAGNASGGGRVFYL